MQKITTIGIDLAKSVFQVHAIGRAGEGGRSAAAAAVADA